jgi:hypothetical protein
LTNAPWHCEGEMRSQCCDFMRMAGYESFLELIILSLYSEKIT